MQQKPAYKVSFLKLLELSLFAHAIFAIPVISVLVAIKYLQMTTALIVVVCLSIIYAPFSATMAYMIAKGSHWANSHSAIKVCVIPPGRFYGLIFGGFIGINLFGWIGGLLLAVLFFFIGRWAGFYLARIFTMRIAPLSSGS